MLYAGDEYYSDDVTSPLYRPMPAPSPRVWAVVEQDGFYLIRSNGRVDETVGGPYVTAGELQEDADAEGWKIINADEVAEWMRPDPLAGLIED